MPSQELLEYVRSRLDAGVPEAKIRADLQKARWPKKDIDDAISAASATAKKSPPAAPAAEKPAGASGGKKVYAIIAIIVIAAGVSTYYFTSLYLSSLIPPNQSQIIPPTQAVCGDGACNGTETYETCPSDCTAPPQNQNVQLSVSPQTMSVSSGQEATFQVSITGINNLYGFQFDFNYDANMLSFVRVTEGTFLNKGGTEQTFCIPPKAAQGTATVACTRLGAIGGVSGNGLLASVTFSGVSSGTAAPTLINVKLVDSSAQTISFRP